MVKPDARRAAARYIQDKYGVSERRACTTTRTHRSLMRYQKKPSSDGTLREQLRDLASRFPRYGYRRLNDRLRRSGTRHNDKKVYRVYCEEKLQVRKRR